MSATKIVNLNLNQASLLYCILVTVLNDDKYGTESKIVAAQVIQKLIGKKKEGTDAV